MGVNMIKKFLFLLVFSLNLTNKTEINSESNQNFLVIVYLNSPLSKRLVHSLTMLTLSESVHFSGVNPMSIVTFPNRSEVTYCWENNNLRLFGRQLPQIIEHFDLNPRPYSIVCFSN